jgi:ABC-type Zn2+ transport system substrate-binding protein/surface adhesin
MISLTEVIMDRPARKTNNLNELRNNINQLDKDLKSIKQRIKSLNNVIYSNHYYYYDSKSVDDIILYNMAQKD